MREESFAALRHAISGASHTAQRDVRIGLRLWKTHLFRERVALLHHRIIILGPVKVRIFLYFFLALLSLGSGESEPRGSEQPSRGYQIPCV